MVKYGYALMTDTANQIGPMVSDPAKRFSGNNLTCQNCHLKAGTQPYAMPSFGVWGQFPQYRGREGEVGTLEERINGCMERSMNGRALPLSGREMKAFLAFSKWVSAGIPDGAKLVGAGALNVKEPGRAADLAAASRSMRRSARRVTARTAWDSVPRPATAISFPRSGESDSYNNGAGMARLLSAAAFLKHNMPFGTTYASPVLSDEDAYDVAGFINSTERPQKADLDKDFPNRLQKPVDAGYGPYADGFSPEQHKLGPFDSIRAKVKELAAQAPQR
jgi:thiosulfate dehydrogenase